MRTKLLVLLGVSVVLAAGVGVVAVLLQSQPGSQITLENLDRIQAGMTEAEVEAILGGPAGDYTAGRVQIIPVPRCMFHPPSKVWIGRKAAVEVSFDQYSNEVLFAEACDTFPPVSFFDRVRAWLGF